MPRLHEGSRGGIKTFPTYFIKNTIEFKQIQVRVGDEYPIATGVADYAPLEITVNQVLLHKYQSRVIFPHNFFNNNQIKKSNHQVCGSVSEAPAEPFVGLVCGEEIDETGLGSPLLGR